MWNLDIEFRRTRLVNNYTAICLIAKFWHLVFILVFWFFFLIRVFELKRIRYSLLAVNTQNFIVLYIMSWLYMFPWFKLIMKKQMTVNYYWFFSNARSLNFRISIHELNGLIKAIRYGLKVYTCPHYSNNFIFFKKYSFFYLIPSSTEVSFYQFKKHALKDYIVSHIL